MTPLWHLVFDLIGLHLLKKLIWPTTCSCTAWPCARPLPPVFTVVSIKPKGLDNRLKRTTIRQQSDSHHHGLWWGSQPVKERPFRRREGLMTDMTHVALLGGLMDADVAGSRALSSLRTLDARTKYSSGFMVASSLPFRTRQDDHELTAFQIRRSPPCSTIYCGATH